MPYCHLLHDACGLLELEHTGKFDKLLPEDYAERTEEGESDVPSLSHHTLASVDVPLALALAEQSERNVVRHAADSLYTNLTILLPCFSTRSTPCSYILKARIDVTNGRGASKSDRGEKSSIANRCVRPLMYNNNDKGSGSALRLQLLA